MTSPYINVPLSLTGSSNLTIKQMEKEQGFFLRIVRAELKLKIYRERSIFQIYNYPGSIVPIRLFAPSCAVCRKVVIDPSMHEHIITRGDVKGVDFEAQMQIYVPWNCVLVHEGDCHIKAQTNEETKLDVLTDLVMIYGKKVINPWIDYIASITNFRGQLPI